MDGTFVRKESLETFENVLRTNLTSAYVVANGALPAMGPGGRFVFLSSSSAHAPQPGRSAYSASKAGLNAFARALAAEVQRDGIAVHVVTTGPVATPMLEDVRFPMRTLGVEEVAGAVVWLDTLEPAVVLPELASSVEEGPLRPGVRPPCRAARPHRALLTADAGHWLAMMSAASASGSTAGAPASTSAVHGAGELEPPR